MPADGYWFLHCRIPKGNYITVILVTVGDTVVLWLVQLPLDLPGSSPGLKLLRGHFLCASLLPGVKIELILQWTCIPSIHTLFGEVHVGLN